MALGLLDSAQFNTGTTSNGPSVRSEFTNILNNALALISPLTGNLDVNAKELISMIPETSSSDPSGGTEGELYYQTTGKTLTWWDGTNAVTGATLGSTQTFRNKTFTGPILTSPILTTPQINDTSEDHQYIVAVKELTADRTVTFPLLTGNVSFVFDSFTQTITNKTIDADNNTVSNLAHGAEVDEPSSGVHGVTGSVVGTTDTQTLSAKTLTLPTIAAITNGGTVTLPSGTDTLVARTSTDTLTNKTLTAPVINTSISGTGFQDQQFNNLVQNGSFPFWSAGTSVAPDGWTLGGAGAAVAREGTIIKHGLYSAKVTRSGADAQILQNVYATAGSTYVRLRTYTLGAWVYATVANRARIRINDGVTAADSSYHTGGSSWEFLTTTLTMGAAITVLSAAFRLTGGDTSAYIDGAVLVEGELAPAFAPHPNDQHLKAIDYQSIAPANFNYGLLRAETGTATTSSSAMVTITFGTAFSKILTIVGTANNWGTPGLRGVSFDSLSTSSAAVQAVNSSDARGVTNVGWMAIGVD